MPPSSKIWTVIIVCYIHSPLALSCKLTRQVNSLASFVSDLCWAFAMLLTTPLVVTVGLSLTIPLSLIGEMVLNSQYSSFVYWIGAAVVFVSFLFVNNESHEATAPVLSIEDEEARVPSHE